MTKALSVITLVLLAVPAFAQDDGGFGGLGGDSVLTGGDIDALFGGGRGNRGNNNNNNDQIPNPENLLLQVKDLLKVKKVPLTKDQEKTLKPFLETETTTMRTDLEAQFGNRGGNRGNNNTATMLQEVFAGVAKANNELLTTMKADLAPDQVALITKAEKDKKTCTVMLDLINPQQLQQNRGNEGNRGNRGGNNNQGFNPPPGFEDLVGFNPGNQGGGNRGNQNNNFLQNMPDRASCTSAASTTAERLAPISSILTKGKKPLTPDQEKKFSGLIETALPKMQEELRAANPNIQQLLNDLNRNRNNQQNQQNNNNNQNQAVNPQTLRNNIVNTIMTQLGIPNNNNNNNNNRGGGRGNQNFNNQNNPNNNPAANNANANNNPANNNQPNQNNQNNPNNQNFNNNRGGRGNQNFNPQAEIRKKNEELYDKIAAKLNPDQATVIKKYKYDQIKARKGAETWRGIMEEEGTPLTPEQLTQIQALFNAQNQLARQYADQLVQAEMAKAPTLEPPPLPANQQQQQQNRNPNNVAQNPAAQLIIQKVMPEVSKRHAILEKSLEDTILKTLTPPQVASFKLNKL